jgi:hypothetical protein
MVVKSPPNDLELSGPAHDGTKIRAFQLARNLSVNAS